MEGTGGTIAATVVDAATLNTTVDEGAGASNVSFPGFVQSTIFSTGLKQQAQS